MYHPLTGEKQACVNCRYWGGNRTIAVVHQSICRHDAPSRNEEGHGVWPLVLSNEWCGGYIQFAEEPR